MNEEEGLIRGFDFHCHVDLHSDPVAIINQCARERIFVLAATTTPKAWEQNRKWIGQNNYVHAATGLHPELVGERYAEIDLLERQIGESQFIGEVGLDGSQQHKKSYDKQKDIFIRVLDASEKSGKHVLTIHSRSAARDVIALIEKHTDPQKLLCILHWFSGSITEARRALAAGCFFSVNHAMLGHQHGRELVRNLPTDRLLTETDSPFTTLGKRKSLPWDVIATVTLLSEVCSMSPTQMNLTLLTNAQRVLHFIGLEIQNFHD